ncbi:MAG: class I SAM-dependent methyltransferase [Myxococcota bacterium]|jgi:SAM-dependent methyltransferase|nr:class I SAM-dependent methyltransferase [Myxococcota bacterium]
MSEERSTRGESYTRRLETLGEAGWKQWLDVQAPYRRHVRGLDLGFVLDVGCGIGRNLVHLQNNGVGVDHNADSVAAARERGCEAFVPADFGASEYAVAGRFDSLLCAHVVEHMSLDEAVQMIASYLQYLRAGGRVVLIAPQQAGYRTDATHVEFMDPPKLARILEGAGAPQERAYSFPFPRFVGHVFPHNEFVAIGRKAPA